MKTLLIALFLAGALSALAQTATVTTNAPEATATTNLPPSLTLTDADTAMAAREASRSLTAPKTPTQLKLERAKVGGIAVQAVKMKKPWNLLNPFAPLSDGEGTNNLVPNSAGGPPGLNVISCSK